MADFNGNLRLYHGRCWVKDEFKNYSDGLWVSFTADELLLSSVQNRAGTGGQSFLVAIERSLFEFSRLFTQPDIGPDFIMAPHLNAWISLDWISHRRQSTYETCVASEIRQLCRIMSDVDKRNLMKYYNHRPWIQFFFSSMTDHLILQLDSRFSPCWKCNSFLFTKDAELQMNAVQSDWIIRSLKMDNICVKALLQQQFHHAFLHIA